MAVSATILPCKIHPSICHGSNTHLVEVEDQIQLAHIAEEGIEHLHKEMYSLQICQFVVVRVDACTEEQPGVSPIYYFGHVPELDEVRLVFLIAGRNEAVDLTTLVMIQMVTLEVLWMACEMSMGFRQPARGMGGSEWGESRRVDVPRP
jgi:hypothetical protein